MKIGAGGISTHPCPVRSIDSHPFWKLDERFYDTRWMCSTSSLDSADNVKQLRHRPSPSRLFLLFNKPPRFQSSISHVESTGLSCVMDHHLRRIAITLQHIESRAFDCVYSTFSLYRDSSTLNFSSTPALLSEFLIVIVIRNAQWTVWHDWSKCR